MKRLLLLLAFASAGAAASQVEWVAAEVVKIDAPRSKITLRHEPIKSIKMDAMTMPFRVADPQTLVPLKVGDKVRIRVELRDDEPVVSHIEAVP